jgi:hypothetical protein
LLIAPPLPSGEAIPAAPGQSLAPLPVVVALSRGIETEGRRASHLEGFALGHTTPTMT